MPDTDAFTGALHPNTARFDTIQSKSLPVIGLSASRVNKSSPKINLALQSGRALVFCGALCCYDFAFF